MGLFTDYARQFFNTTGQFFYDHRTQTFYYAEPKEMAIQKQPARPRMYLPGTLTQEELACTNDHPHIGIPLSLAHLKNWQDQATRAKQFHNVELSEELMIRGNCAYGSSGYNARFGHLACGLCTLHRVPRVICGCLRELKSK